MNVTTVLLFFFLNVHNLGHSFDLFRKSAVAVRRRGCRAPARRSASAACRTLLCWYCGLDFRQRSPEELLAHVRQRHPWHRAADCPACGANYGYNVMRHLRQVHGGERGPLACLECGGSSRARSNPGRRDGVRRCRVELAQEERIVNPLGRRCFQIYRAR